MNKHEETFGIDIYYGDVTGANTLEQATAAAGDLDTLAGEIKDLGDLAGFTGGEKIKVSRVNQAKRVNQYAPGMIDPAPLSFTLGFDPENIAALAALKMVKKGWMITFDDAPQGGTPTRIIGDGFITEFKIAGKAGDEATAAVTVQPMDEWYVIPAAPAAGGGA